MTVDSLLILCSAVIEYNIGNVRSSKNFIERVICLIKFEPCVDYIQECLYVAMPGVGYLPFHLWDTQKRYILDVVNAMFDNDKDMYILLGSRQCGKTTCTTAICDWLTTFYQKYNIVLIHLDDGRGKGQNM